MSSKPKFLFALAALTALSTPENALAQDAPSVSQADSEIAENMPGTGGRITRDTSRRNCLKTIKQGEIIVCAPDEDEFRVPSTADDDPTGAAGTDDGRLRAPDVAGDGIFKGKATASGMCLVPPCPPEQPLLIDLSQIPEAPAGSDADKVARGEMRAN